MSLFLETIRFENGRFDNLLLHQQRLEEVVWEWYGPGQSPPLLEDVLNSYTKGFVYEKDQPYKCRVVYGRNIESVTVIRYRFPEIHSLKLIEANHMDYHLKYLDRKALTELYRQRGEYDDVLIVKNGLITDTTFSNVLFYDGSKWFTPDLPLLKGTRRQHLLMQGKIHRATIHPDDLSSFSKVRLINAMMRFEDNCDVAIRRVGW